jgi:hypothetical protein
MAKIKVVKIFDVVLTRCCAYLPKAPVKASHLKCIYRDSYKIAKKTEPLKTLSFPVRLSRSYGVVRICFTYQFYG